MAQADGSGFVNPLTMDEPPLPQVRPERGHWRAPGRIAVTRRRWWGDLFAFLAWLSAFGLRWAADEAMPPGFPYVTFFPAIIITTYLHGVRPGILCAVLSGLSAWYFFIPPFHTFILSWHILVALSFFSFVSIVDIVLIHRVQAATERLSHSRAAIQDLHANLARQVEARTAELRRETALKGAILDNAGYAVIATDLAGVITLFNPAAERLLGHAAEDIVGKASSAILLDPGQVETCAAALPPRPGAPPAEGFELCMLSAERDQSKVREWIFVSRRSERVPVLLNVSALRLEDGSELGFLGIAMDLREQYRHEAVLRAADAGTWKVDVKSGRAWLSAECARQHGLAEAPIELDGVNAWPSLVHPADAPRAVADLQAAIAARGSLTTEFRIPLDDGSVRWLTAVGTVEADVSGMPLRMMGLTLDITETRRNEMALRDSEQRYRMLAENTADMIVQSDVDTTRRYVSPASRKLLGYEPHELVGTKADHIVHPDDVVDACAAIRTLHERHVDTLVTRKRFRRKDGTYVWVEVSYQRIEDATGAITGYMSCARDISVQHAQAEALNVAKAAAERSQIEAERASQSKTDFLAAMSHEIRTPLNAVIGFTDLMIRSGRLDDDLAGYAGHVQGSGMHLLGVVNDILDFSKVEAGAVELLPEAFSPHSLIDECLSMVAGVGQTKGIAVAEAVDPRLPPALIGDRARLRQVLVNLLNNAVKFTKVGSVTLKVRRLRSTAHGECIRFGVHDTGIGIASDQLDRLFQRFTQVDGSIHRDFGGTGLGLAIAKRLVELMDGEIKVSSVEGEGSTFWFEVTLPRAKPSEVAVRAYPVAGARREARLLLVEDNAVNQVLACAVLEDLGYTVDVVCDGASAIHAVLHGAYDLVLMDIHMPAMDGMTATRRIRDLDCPAARLPIVAMTANVLPEQVRRFREAGLDDHICKPFHASDLYATIERWLSPDTATAEASPSSGTTPFDQASYDAIRRVLSPGRLVDVLELFIQDLRTGFAGPHEKPTDRLRLREEAHSFGSSAGLIGFQELATACLLLEASTEEWVAAQGPDGFGRRLERLRGLAADAQATARRLAEEQRAGEGHVVASRVAV